MQRARLDMSEKDKNDRDEMYWTMFWICYNLLVLMMWHGFVK